jgi:hypothetical protein
MSINLPGVAIITWTPYLHFSLVSRVDVPPMQQNASIFKYYPIPFTTS